MAHISEQKHCVAEVTAGNDGRGILETKDLQNDDTPGDEDTHEYLHGWALKSLAMALMSSGFMLSLDDTILGTHFQMWITVMNC